MVAAISRRSLPSRIVFPLALIFAHIGMTARHDTNSGKVVLSSIGLPTHVHAEWRNGRAEDVADDSWCIYHIGST